MLHIELERAELQKQTAINDLKTSEIKKQLMEDQAAEYYRSIYFDSQHSSTRISDSSLIRMLQKKYARRLKSRESVDIRGASIAGRDCVSRSKNKRFVYDKRPLQVILVDLPSLRLTSNIKCFVIDGEKCNEQLRFRGISLR